MIALASALTLVLAASDPEPDALSGPPVVLEPHLVPPFVPRSISFGLSINSPMLTPNVRLDWDIDLFTSTTHNFYLLVELGSGFGVNRAPGMTAVYQHLGVLGFGYRNITRVIHWGFQFGIGPLWYRTFYSPIEPYQTENRVIGYAEGRLQGGYEFNKHLVLGIYFGFGSPFLVEQKYPGTAYLGGFMPGIFLEWL